MRPSKQLTIAEQDHPTGIAGVGVSRVPKKLAGTGKGKTKVGEIYRESIRTPTHILQPDSARDVTTGYAYALHGRVRNNFQFSCSLVLAICR